MKLTAQQINSKKSKLKERTV